MVLNKENNDNYGNVSMINNLGAAGTMESLEMSLSGVAKSEREENTYDLPDVLAIFKILFSFH